MSSGWEGFDGKTIRTVGELIAKLQAYDPNAVIGIDDADTDWHLAVTEVCEVDGRVLIRGDYTHRLDEEDES